MSMCCTPQERDNKIHGGQNSLSSLHRQADRLVAVQQIRLGHLIHLESIPLVFVVFRCYESMTLMCYPVGSRCEWAFCRVSGSVLGLHPAQVLGPEAPIHYKPRLSVNKEKIQCTTFNLTCSLDQYVVYQIETVTFDMYNPIVWIYNIWFKWYHCSH